MSPSYTSGPWIPAIESIGPSDHGYCAGEYRKISDVVHVTMRLVLKKKRSGADAVSIVGLPFVVGGSVGASYCSPIRFLDMTTPIICLAGEFNGNTIQLYKLTTPATAWTPLAFDDLSDKTDLRLSGTYFTDAQEAK